VVARRAPRFAAALLTRRSNGCGWRSFRTGKALCVGFDGRGSSPTGGAVFSSRTRRRWTRRQQLGGSRARIGTARGASARGKHCSTTRVVTHSTRRGVPARVAPAAQSLQALTARFAGGRDAARQCMTPRCRSAQPWHVAWSCMCPGTKRPPHSPQSHNARARASSACLTASRIWTEGMSASTCSGARRTGRGVLGPGHTTSSQPTNVPLRVMTAPTVTLLSCQRSLWPGARPAERSASS